LYGGMGLMLDEQHSKAEIGYWIGLPFWGRGYATEAAREVVRYGFQDLKLNRIFAGVYGGNEASMRILTKLGFKHEGTLRQHYLKWGRFLDSECYGLLRSEWSAA
jgi:RimJ/RimL family protein N-acetyltransferase